MKRKTDGLIDPHAMTVKWLQRQKDDHLATLCKHWENWCCRGHMIREEIKRREKLPKFCSDADLGCAYASAATAPMTCMFPKPCKHRVYGERPATGIPVAANTALRGDCPGKGV